jgi:hypothetical protein
LAAVAAATVGLVVVVSAVAPASLEEEVGRGQTEILREAAAALPGFLFGALQGKLAELERQQPTLFGLAAVAVADCLELEVTAFKETLLCHKIIRAELVGLVVAVAGKAPQAARAAQAALLSAFTFEDQL